MNPLLAPGRLTSGRRTYRGNRLVGGVSDSHHLDGSAGDYTGTNANALKSFFGPGVKIIPEADHLHVQGLPAGTFPYYGNQGIAGLVNGVDTTAPKGTAVAPRKPRTLADIGKPDLNAPMPLGLDASQMPSVSPMSLGDLAGTLPQGQIPKPNKTGHTLGTIAGVLGDALMAYGGMQPQFGPNLARQQEDERQQGYDREKFNALLEQKRQEAMAPPQWLEDAITFQNLPAPQRDAVLGYQDAVHPIFTATPQGTQLNKRLQSSTRVIDGRTYYLVNGDWYDNPEGR